MSRRDQDKYYSIYRGRQSALHHVAYMRTGKLKAAELILQRNGIALSDISVFDHGFGAGTFLRRCAPSCRLAGVELDPENVQAVRAMLKARGHDVSAIAPVSATDWTQHPLLARDRRYDLIVLSHVLEHLDDPAGLLTRLEKNLSARGHVLGLVPINELVADEDHKWRCDRQVVHGWSRKAGLRVVDYVELDHFMYYLIPIAVAKNPAARIASQALSLLLGLAQARVSPSRWFAAGERCARPIFAKPAQAAFLLARESGGA